MFIYFLGIYLAFLCFIPEKLDRKYCYFAFLLIKKKYINISLLLKVVLIIAESLNHDISLLFNMHTVQPFFMLLILQLFIVWSEQLKRNLNSDPCH